MNALDAHHMTQAIRIARRGLGRTAPNPSVGAIVVTPDGEIAGRGWTAPGGRPHAEAVALDHAGGLAEGSTLYVTLEPCAHESPRGTPCANAIIEAKVKRVVIGIRDPDPRTAGRGIARLKAAGIDVSLDVCAREAHWITLGHVLRINEGRPAVTLKLAASSDGRIPQGGGTPVWVTGPQARAHGHLLRAMNDAILIGRGTVIADNPSLTCRLPGMADRSPVRVVFDRHLRTPGDAKLFEDSSVPVLLLCAADYAKSGPQLSGDTNAEIIPSETSSDDLIDPKRALEEIARRGVTRLLVEGGPSIARSFLDADLVDEVAIYRGATPAGDKGLTPFGGEGLDRITKNSHFTELATRSFGPDRMTRWRRKRSCSQALSAA